jgi:hypothetical protein
VESLWLLVSALPWLLVWLTAGLLAGVWWKRHPAVSALVVSASALHIVNGIAMRLIPAIMRERGESLSNLGVITSLFSLIGLAGTVCVIVAVFIDRNGNSPVADRTSSGNF